MNVSNHWKRFRRKNAQKSRGFQALEKLTGAGSACFQGLEELMSAGSARFVWIGLLESREAKREAIQPGCIMHDWVDYQTSKQREDKVAALRKMISRRAMLSPSKTMKVVDGWLLLLWKDSPEEDFQICRELIETNAGSDWEGLLYDARLELAAGNRQEALRGLREAVRCAPQMITDWADSTTLSSETAYLDFVSNGDGVMRYFFLKKWAAAAKDFLPLLGEGQESELLQRVNLAWDQQRKARKNRNSE